MRVLVMGGLGNMGRRYSAILSYLNHTPVCLDVAAPKESWAEALAVPCEHVIIATPTDAHENSLAGLLDEIETPMHILCEKPLARSLDSVKAMFSLAKDHGSTLSVVNQYAFLPEYHFVTMSSGVTTYNYFNHGKDGLYWDCFQLFALASRDVMCAETSPVWKCTINSVPISIAGMDGAYVDMVKNFLGPKMRMWRRDLVLETTQRILELCEK